jgi:cob(I)alamin adenosyltransferase
MSIATKRGDSGQTGLAGGIRVSKSSLRVEACGTVDELNSALGVARSRCESDDLQGRTKVMEGLTRQVYEVEATEGLLSDWSLPGEHPTCAAYDFARTVCRRAERCVVRLTESGETVDPNILAYLNRLSELLWLFARKIEVDAGIGNSLREMNGKSGAKWSRAW